MTARVALVTGASSGIGAATAVALGAHGYTVGLAARRRERLDEVVEQITSSGGQAVALETDVADDDSVHRSVLRLTEMFGPVDVAVSNAGSMWPDAIRRLTALGLNEQINVNLTGMHRIVSEVLGSMIERSAGDIVLVTSLNASVPRPLLGAYNAAKAAVENYGRTLQMECEGTGVRVSMVRPGPTLTEMGWNWPAHDINEVLESWSHWGLQRHHDYMPPTAIADAVVTAATAAPGVNYSLIEVLPTAPLSSKGPSHG